MTREVKNVEPLVKKILMLVDLGKEDQIPLPKAIRKTVLEKAAEQGAHAAAGLIEELFSRDNINEQLLNLFQEINEDYYKNSKERAEEKRLGPVNLARYRQAAKETAEKRGYISRFTHYISRSHIAYFGESVETPEEEINVAVDQDLIDGCDRLIHKVSLLVPSSILKTVVGVSSIRGSVAESLAQKLQVSLHDEFTFSDIIDKAMQGAVNEGKKAAKIENPDRSVRQMRVEAELRALDREQLMLSAGTECFTHVYMDLLLSSIGSIGKRINRMVNYILGPASPYVKSFLRFVMIASLFNAVSYLLSWMVFPFIKLFIENLLIRPYLAFRSNSIADFLYLDINENLAGTAIESVVDEFEKALDAELNK